MQPAFLFGASLVIYLAPQWCLLAPPPHLYLYKVIRLSSGNKWRYMDLSCKRLMSANTTITFSAGLLVLDTHTHTHAPTRTHSHQHVVIRHLFSTSSLYLVTLVIQLNKAIKVLKCTDMELGAGPHTIPGPWLALCAGRCPGSENDQTHSHAGGGEQ